MELVVLNRPALDIHLRIANSDFVVQMAKVPASEAFDNVEGVAVREEAEATNNGLRVIEACRIDYQRVAVPSSNGVPRPSGIGVFGESPSVHEDLAVAGIKLVKDHDQSFKRKDFERIKPDAHRKILRQTSPIAGVFLVLPLPGFSLWRKNNVFRFNLKSSSCGVYTISLSGPSSFSQIPSRSGLPSAVRGA